MHNDHVCVYNSIFESRSSVNGSIPTGVFDSRLVSDRSRFRAVRLPSLERVRTMLAREGTRRFSISIRFRRLVTTSTTDSRVSPKNRKGGAQVGEKRKVSGRSGGFAESFPARDRRNSIVEAKMERRANNGGLNFYRMDSSGLGLEGRTIRERFCWITRALVG